MPRKTSLIVPKKSRPSRRRKSSSSVVEHAASETSPVCPACRSFPVGSIELVSLLLVLVFSLSAVLLTSGYALDQQNQRVAQAYAQAAE